MSSTKGRQDNYNICYSTKTCHRPKAGKTIITYIYIKCQTKTKTTQLSWFRDQPFNLKGGGGLWFFVSFRIFFSDNTRVRIFFFCRAKCEIFFKNSTLGCMTKTLNQIIFFFLHQNQNIFFSNIGNQNIFLEKKHNPPLQVKWSFPKRVAEIILDVFVSFFYYQDR